MSEIKLGINNCFAVKRWPEPEKWAEIIAEELKLSIVQFSLDLIDLYLDSAAKLRACERIKKAAQDRGIVIHSCFTGLAEYSRNLLLDPDSDMRNQAVGWYEKSIEFASALGCEAVGGHFGAMSEADYNNDKRRAFLTEVLSNEIIYLSKAAKSNGLKYLLWEPMPVDRELISKIAEAAEFYKKVNEVSEIPVYLNLDLGHMCSYSNSPEDRDPYNWLKILSPYSPVIHIQQCSGKSDSHSAFTAVNNEWGIIKPEKVIDAIKESGAKETVLMLEVIHPFECRESIVIDELKESADYWRKYLK